MSKKLTRLFLAWHGPKGDDLRMEGYGNWELRADADKWHLLRIRSSHYDQAVPLSVPPYYFYYVYGVDHWVYLDGQQLTGCTLSHFFGEIPPVIVHGPNASSNIRLGWLGEGISFKGLIDDLVIFDGSLTPAATTTYEEGA